MLLSSDVPDPCCLGTLGCNWQSIATNKHANNLAVFLLNAGLKVGHPSDLNHDLHAPI